MSPTTEKEEKEEEEEKRECSKCKESKNLTDFLDSRPGYLNEDRFCEKCSACRTETSERRREWRRRRTQRDLLEDRIPEGHLRCKNGHVKLKRNFRSRKHRRKVVYTKQCHACTDLDVRQKKSRPLYVKMKKHIEHVKGKGCSTPGCGIKECIQFHHLGKKKKEISNIVWWAQTSLFKTDEDKWKEFQKELDVTVPICAICHFKSTKEQRREEMEKFTFNDPAL